MVPRQLVCAGGSFDQHKGGAKKIEVPADGVRNGKELKISLTDIEQYFMASYVSDSNKINLTNIYVANSSSGWTLSKVFE